MLNGVSDIVFFRVYGRQGKDGKSYLWEKLQEVQEKINAKIEGIYKIF